MKYAKTFYKFPSSPCYETNYSTTPPPPKSLYYLIHEKQTNFNGSSLLNFKPFEEVGMYEKVRHYQISEIGIT